MRCACDRQIRSDDDPRLAPYARVGDAGWLRQQGLFVAEGRLVVERLIDAGRFGIDSIVLTPAARDALAARLAALETQCGCAARTSSTA